MKIRTLLGIVLAALSIAVSAGDRVPPASWSLDEPAEAQLSRLFIAEHPALDLESLALEDSLNEALGEPPRFAIPRASSFNLHSDGDWEVTGDTSIWRMRVRAEGAVLLNFGFSDLHLPDGAALYVYTVAASKGRTMDPHQVIGPYTSSINREHGEFWTPNLHADDVIIELNVARASRDAAQFEISQVSQGYRGFGEAAREYRQPEERLDGDGKQSCKDAAGTRSGDCNQDVACLSEDDPWNEPRRSVGAYQRSGAFACTGSLVNNTANDQSMLFITASHCITAGQAPSIVVYWNYEWPTCRRPGDPEGTGTNPPNPNITNTGGTFLAATSNPFGGQCTAPDECSDVTLIELDDPADPEFDLFWSGWDRRPPPTACAQGPGNSTEGLCATIHHPGVDEKRITWVADNIQIGDIAGAQNLHWHPFWHPDPPELPNMPAGGPIPPAVTEPGSSGSPLYTADRRFIGVLSGGPAFCGATGASLADFYGGLWHAWEGMGTPTTRMRDYLDPLGTNPEFIDGNGGDAFGLTPQSTQISQCGFDDLTIEIDVTQTGEANDPVTLSAVELPTGVGADFSVNPVTPPGDSVLTVSDLIAAGTGTFVFAVEGVSADGDVSVDLSVTLSDDDPALATITSPADGAVGVPIEPVLEWTDADQAFQYQIEIATDPAFNDVVYTGTSFATTYTVSSALDTNATYFLRVRASNECGVGDWSDAVTFSTEALPGDCPLGTEAESLFSEDFAGGSLPAGWSTDGSTGAVTWQISSDQTHSAGFSMFAENIASISDQRLATPSVSLPADAEALFLNFQNWQQIESSAAGCFDGGLLEISADGGSNWSTVGNEHIIVREYDGEIDTGFDNPLAGQPGWCGDPRDFWERYAINLAAWAGEDVQFRFRFGTDSSVSRVGWFVDSLEVRACVQDAPVTIGGTVEGLEGNGLVLQNNGGDDLTIDNNGAFTFASALQPGQPYQVTVSAQPLDPAQQCSVDNASGTAGQEDVTDVLVSCQALGVLEVVTGSLSFGEVPEGSSASQTLTVSNAAAAGAMDIELAALQMIGDAEFQIVGGDCSVGTLLAAESSCQVEVRFSPDSAAVFAGTLQVLSADGQALEVTMNGQGMELDPGEADVSPGLLAFGAVPTNLGNTLDVTVSNVAPDGAAELAISQVAVIAGQSVFSITQSDCGDSLEAGSACSVSLRFAPISETSYSGVLRIVIDGSAYNLSLTGQGAAPDPMIFRDRFEHMAEPE